MHRRLVTAVALALAGCMVGPDYQRPQTTLPTAYAYAPAAATRAAATPAVRADWWMLYGDRTLDDLVATALSDNLDVAAAVARIEEFDADLREANAALFPEIDLAGSAVRSRCRRRSKSISGDVCAACSKALARRFWRHTTPRTSSRSRWRA